jgi:transposase
MVFYFGASRIQLKCNVMPVPNETDCIVIQRRIWVEDGRWSDCLFYHFYYFIWDKVSAWNVNMNTLELRRYFAAASFVLTF